MNIRIPFFGHNHKTIHEGQPHFGMTQNGITDAVILVQQRRTMKTGILFSPFGSEQNDEYILSAIKSAGFDSFFSDARCNEEKI